jgi:HlyD family secretion protein
VHNGEDFPSALEQAESRPEYDGTLASMQSQLENLRLQQIEARMQDAQLASSFTNYLWGGYNQTGEQITSLMEQFAELRQVKRQDYLKQLKELQEKLQSDSAITAGFSGTLSALNIKASDFVQPGTVVATVIRASREELKPSAVTLYVPADKGKLAEVGMDVSISPATVNREEHGYILGRVAAVSDYAVSREHMMQTLQNDALVQMFAGQTAVLELTVELYRDAGTVSGYLWSTPKGAPLAISPGTICSGEVKVAQKKPIDMVVPFMKRLFGGGDGT